MGETFCYSNPHQKLLGGDFQTPVTLISFICTGNIELCVILILIFDLIVFYPWKQQFRTLA